MSELITQTARLVPYAKRPKQSGGFVTAYIYEPMADDPGSKLGSFYVVLEALVSGRASEEVADLIIETVGENYYNRPVVEHQSLADRFEAAVKAANTELGEHVNRGNAAWIGKLSAVVAVQTGAELHIAHTGSGEAFLYRGHSATRITDNSPNRPATPTKTFGSIATGQLEAGDHILLATPALVHQVPLPRLKSIVSGSSPNTSIAEITELLRGTSTDRIACLIIEITTPELAALRVRSETPNEIHLGTPETPLETAKQAAAPIADTTARSGKKVAGAAWSAVKKVRPHARKASLGLVDYMRRAMATSNGRRISLITASVLVLGVLAFALASASNHRRTHLVNQYQAAYHSFLQAQQQYATGDKTGAATSARSAQKQLDALKPAGSTLNSALAHSHSLQSNEPHSTSAFQSQLNTFVNELSGLAVVQSTTLATLVPASSKPSRFEIYNGKAYIFDTDSSKQASIISLSNGATIKSKADLSNIGIVKYTSLASDNTGIYILTDKPGVWFYRFNNDSVSPMTTAFGQWPAGNAIASYLSNLYLLSDNVVYKYPKTAAGFAPPVRSLSLTGQGSPATSLAVDGSIYTANSSQILRYVAGKLISTTNMPSDFGISSELSSAANGSMIVATSSQTGRVAVWSVGTTKLTFVQQAVIQGISKLYCVTYNSQTDTYYATADHNLVSFKLTQ